jgi:hypothetical protein
LSADRSVDKDADLLLAPDVKHGMPLANPPRAGE